VGGELAHANSLVIVGVSKLTARYLAKAASDFGATENLSLVRKFLTI
jgi:hypothetical protein